LGFGSVATRDIVVIMLQVKLTRMLYIFSVKSLLQQTPSAFTINFFFCYWSLLLLWKL